MCFVIIAGCKTTASGNVIMGANDDWPSYPGHVAYNPRRVYAKGSMRQLANGSEIPQVTETAAYFTCTCAYATGTLPESWAFGMNEHQVSVGMTGVYAFRMLNSSGALEADDLSIIALERARSAKDAVEILGDLINRYGLALSCVDDAYGAVVVGLADSDEGWWLEATPGGLWAASRVPDDMVSWRPNCFGIQEIDFNDSERFLCSPNLREIAQEQGWYDGLAPFVFSSVLGAGGETSVAYGNENSPSNSYRRWHAQRLISAQEQNLDDKVYLGYPNRQLTAQSIMNILRDSSEGSGYDLSQRPEAGLYHNPFWMAESTSLGQAGTVLAVVFEARRELPPEIGALMWLALSNIHLTPFMPCYIGGEDYPEAFRQGEYRCFDENAPWWNFQELGQLCYHNYDAIARKKVIPAVRSLEESFLVMQLAVEQNFLIVFKDHPRQAQMMLKAYNQNCAGQALELVRRLTQHIKGHHLSNINLQ